MSFIDVGHIAMGITTIIPIYDFIYLPQEDDVEETYVPKGAPISSPEQQVMGFYMMMAPGMMMMPTKV